jgi:hypothetical protein
MQLIRHLNDEELTDLLLEQNERELQPILGGLPASLRTSTDLPEWFWQGQQAATRRHLAAGRIGRFHPVMSLASAMTLVVLALLLLRGNPSHQPIQVQADPDQALLVAVEQAVQSEVPSALEPAALLADEISNGSTTQIATPKENRNEN